MGHRSCLTLLASRSSNSVTIVTTSRFIIFLNVKRFFWKKPLQKTSILLHVSIPPVTSIIHLWASPHICYPSRKTFSEPHYREEDREDYEAHQNYNSPVCGMKTPHPFVLKQMMKKVGPVMFHPHHLTLVEFQASQKLLNLDVGQSLPCRV